jgi:hypothetical protein
MAPSPQQVCFARSSVLLQYLHDDGIGRITSAMLSEWSMTMDLTSLPPAMILIDRLQFLWKTIEQTKVSLALHNGALMSAFSYTYKGHDSGWSPGEIYGQDLA